MKIANILQVVTIALLSGFSLNIGLSVPEVLTMDLALSLPIIVANIEIWMKNKNAVK